VTRATDAAGAVDYGGHLETVGIGKERKNAVLQEHGIAEVEVLDGSMKHVIFAERRPVLTQKIDAVVRKLLWWEEAAHPLNALVFDERDPGLVRWLVDESRVVARPFRTVD
jgi:hypothetical protein